MFLWGCSAQPWHGQPHQFEHRSLIVHFGLSDGSEDHLHVDQGGYKQDPSSVMPFRVAPAIMATHRCSPACLAVLHLTCRNPHPPPWSTRWSSWQGVATRGPINELPLSEREDSRCNCTLNPLSDHPKDPIADLVQFGGKSGAETPPGPKPPRRCGGGALGYPDNG